MNIRRISMSLALLVVLACPLVASAATTDFRILLNVDNDIATGCTISTMPGVDQVFTTRVTTTADTAAVTQTFRQVCTSGALGPQIPVDGTGWPAGFQSSSGQLFVETRIPFSAFPDPSMAHNMRIGLVAVQGSSVHTAVTRPNGDPVYFPVPSGRRRAVSAPGAARMIILDGLDPDWQGLKAMFEGIASGGVAGLRMEKFFAFADTNRNIFFFRFDVNVSANAPLAQDDAYTRPAGSGLTVPGVSGPTVLANDTDPNGLPLTATLVSQPPAGDVVLTQSGGFTYTPDNPASTAPDTFEYKANNGHEDSNVATVTIAVDTPTTGAPVFTSTATPSVPENTTSVVTLTATDPDNDPITFSITGGADQSRFVLTGGNQLAFTVAPDFEAPLSNANTNTYFVQVTASDGNGGVTTQSLTVTVTNVDEAPFFTTGTSFNVPENTTAVTTVAAQDPDGTPIAYSIGGGSDSAFFTINSSTGALSFTSAPDFESPADAGANNTYTVFVAATDGNGSVTMQTLVITVTAVNEAPSITSSPSASVPENTTAVLTVTAVDPEAQAVTYSITGGADQARFSITAGGVLTFLVAPDFEAPTDAGANNQYQVQVTATDGTNPVSQLLTVTVTDVNETPAFTSPNSASVPENTITAATVTTSDPDGDTIAYSITGGADQARFTIGASSGILSFTAAPNFEAPADADTNNQYIVQVTATDGQIPINQTITVTVTDVNEAPAITSPNTASVPENTTGVTTVTSTDQEGNTVTYTVTGGADAAKFAIGLNSGVLTFLAAPNYDIPGDANADNQYIVQVTATDGTTPVSQTITVTVTDVNEAPSFTSGTAFNVPENTTAVTTVTTADPESAAISYSITGGADAALFTIGSSSGVLSFLSAPNFEAPADAGANNVYDVQITATDGVNPVNQTVAVTVTNVNEAPAFTSGSTPSIPENTLTATTVTTTEPEGQAVTYTITGGADSALFTIGLNSGVLTFNAPPNFEAPADANTDNQYVVQVTATDGTNPVNQTITVTVTDVNEAPSFTSSATPSVAENTTAVITVTTTDPESNTITYSITGGVDSAFFTINTNSGALSFLTGRDFEAPADSGANNVYDVQVTATDGTNPVVQNLAVTVTNQNDPPAFTSANTASVPENTTAVTTVTTTDPEGQTVTYTITGGADAAFFSVGLNSGVLTFNAPPNFEAPADSNADNQYIVQVTANDGTNTVNQTITVTVTNVNEAPSFTSTNTASVPENTTAVKTVTTTDPEAQAVTYTITGGADQAFFSITSGGVLTFLAPRNFEAPADANADNQYIVQVTATDGTNPVNQTITVTVTNVDEAPSFTSTNTASVPENTTAVTTVTTTDPEGQTVTYTVTGGADQAKFAIGLNSGVLTFLVAPDFDIPGDANADNQYIVQVTANDGTNNTNQTITVTVTNVNEAPSFTSTNTASVPENTTAVKTVTTTDPEAQAVTYTITGGADQAFFSITAGGVLTFLAPRNFEAPADSNADNQYIVQVTATDGTNPVNQTITVTVTNVNEGPAFTSTATPSVPENSTAVLTITTTDPESNPITYTITGGADQAKFSVGLNSGALTFNVAPNFEAPTDAGANNVYDVQVTATDGSIPAVQNLAVTVTNVNEAPSFTSGNNFTQGENLTAVTTVTTTDPEGQAVTYTVTGGLDQARFSVGLNSGALAFIAPPDFEVPTDSDANNVYVVQVTATDGTNPVNQTITVTITNVNEGPQFVSSATPSVPENTTAVITVSAPDPEGSAVTYTITGGADQAKFSVGLNSGALTFNTAPNFEAPTDAGANNVYDVQVTATDGTNPAVQNLAVTVTNVNEAPAFTSSATPSVPENTTAVITTVAVDPDGTTPTYSITGGADAAKFSITGAGVLTFLVAPNFEVPTDVGANNVYNVDVTATDGTNPVVQSLTVTVTDVNEAPSFTSSNAQSVPENTTAVTTVSATDPEGAAVTYSLTGGADQAKFSIVSGTGVLTFLVAPNFEIPTDVGANNVYDVQITATDGTNPIVQNMAVTVTNVNEAPVNAVPGLQTFNEDINRVFNVANANLISISDVDAGTNSVQVTLAATNGTLSTNGVVGLTFTPPGAGNDGVDDATLTFTGTIANINTALNGLTYKPTANYYGSAQITITTDDLGNTGSGGAQQDSDPIALTISPVNDPPVATAKTHTTHSGIGLTINAATNTGELKEGATDVDDHDPFSELTVQLVAGSVTPAGSTVTLLDASDGSFYYEPRGGVSGAGAGSFQFQVCDDGSVPLGLAPQCSAATTVTINITGPDLWFVDDTDASVCGVNCNGSRTKPLVGLNNGNANFVARGTGDKIFAFSGTYNHGHTFAANEQLIGQASSGTFDAVLGVSVPGNGTLDARPGLGGPAVTLQNTVTGATNMLMRGIAVSIPSGGSTGFTATGATQITVLESSVASTGPAVSVNNVSAHTTNGVTFSSTTSTGGANGISLIDASNTFAFGSGALTNNTAAAFALSNTAVNAPTVTFSGNINPTGANGRPIDIGTATASSGLRGGSITLSGNIGNTAAAPSGIRVRNSTAGTLTLSGSTFTLTTAAINAVELTTNPGTTFNFNPGTSMAISTTSGRGFLASGGGTINVTGASNTINTSNGTAFDVFGVPATHMGGTYSFQSISADVDGPGNSSVNNNGIHLEYHDGPFTISGDGADVGTAPDSLTSGGTISGASERGAEFLNVTGLVSLNGMTFTNAAKTQSVAGSVCGLNLNTGNNTNCNAALHFDTTSGGVTLNKMLVDGSVQEGINGYTVTNLNMTDIEVRNVGDEVGENGILMKNLLGTGTGTNLNLHDNEAKQLNFINTLNNDLTSFTITGSTFANSAAPNGGQGMLLQTYDAGTSMVVSVTGSTFSGLFSNAHQVSTNSGSTQNVTMTGNTITNANAWTVIQASDGGANNFTVSNNNGTTGALSGSNAINVKTDNADLAGTPSSATGTISGNTIGSGTVGSGAVCGGGCSGIVVAQRDGGAVTVNITNNTVRHVDAQGIQITGGNSYSGNAGKVVAVVTGNLVMDPDGGTLAGIHVQSGTQSGDTNCVQANVGGAVNPGSWPSATANAMNRIEGNWDPTTAPTFSAGNEIFLWRRFTSTLNIPGYTGVAFVAGQNSITSADGAPVGQSGTPTNGSCP